MAAAAGHTTSRGLHGPGSSPRLPLRPQPGGGPAGLRAGGGSGPARPGLHDSQVGRDIQHSHWSSSYITELSLVESFRVLKHFHYVKGIQRLLSGFMHRTNLLGALRIDSFRAWKPPILCMH